MKQLISSRATFGWKFIFPLIWSSGFGLGTILLFLDSVDSNGKPIPGFMKWQFLIIWVLGTALIVWLVAPLKCVFRDKSNLYIANYKTEVIVPLAEVATVRENQWIHIGGKHPIVLNFHTPTNFGNKIVFIPTGKAPFAWPWQKKPHPIARELQEITNSKTRK